MRSCNSIECALLLVIELHGCLLLATAASAAAECETESFGKLRPSPIIFGGELADLELDLEFGAPLLFQCNRMLLRKFHPIYLFSEFPQILAEVFSKKEERVTTTPAGTMGWLRWP